MEILMITNVICAEPWDAAIQIKPENQCNA
jgi:hypothetical protein